MDKKKSVERDDAHESETLPQEALEIIETLPEEKRRVVIASIESTIFKGPLPHPDLLKSYNESVEQGAERIMRMAEKQLEHRLALEKEIIFKQQQRSSWGQTLGFLLSVLCILSATFLGYHGHGTLAGVIATTTILGLVGAFVLGKHQQDTEKR